MANSVAVNEWPRLTGELSYSAPHSWQLSRDDKRLAIIPADPPRALIGYFLVLSITTGLAIPFWTMYEFDLRPLLAIGMGILFAVGFAYASFLINAYQTLEKKRGPGLIVDFDGKRLSFPRENVSYPLDRVIRCEVVSGTHIRGPNGRPRAWDEISELQIILIEDDGSTRAKAVIGGGCRYDTALQLAAAEIAEAMQIPCNQVNDESA